jgi:hypothetical protein
LERLFDHAPTGSDPRFDFAEVLDEDAVVIFDLGRLRPEEKRGLTLVLLSNCWSALRRRYRQASPEENLPLVNLYLEEAGAIATSDLLQSLLARGREFECAVTLAMQFPGQLRASDEEAYAELLNNVGTYVTGNVGVDHEFAPPVCHGCDGQRGRRESPPEPRPRGVARQPPRWVRRPRAPTLRRRVQSVAAWPSRP